MREIPILRMLNTPLSELRDRAESIACALNEQPGLTAKAEEDVAYVGGGSLPDQAMKTWVVRVQAHGVGEEEIARRLRLGQPAVLARLHEGKLVLDVRTVFVEQRDALVDAIRQAAATKKAPV